MSSRKQKAIYCTIAFSMFALVLFSSFAVHASKDRIPTNPFNSLIEDVSLLVVNRNIPIEPITSSLEEHIGSINSVGRWDNLDKDTYTYSIVEVKPGEEISLKCNGMIFMAFLKSYHNPIKGERPDYSEADKDKSERFSLSPGVHKLIVPEGTNYLYFSRKLKGRESTPRYLYVDYVNILEGLYPDVPQNVFEDYPSDMQQVCIHHDSFCREIAGNKWHIGTNGGEVFAMNYISPRSDYDYVDDGFRLVNGHLTNDQTVSVSEAFRLIERKLSEEMLFEVAVPSMNKSYERIVLNFKDSQNFDSFQLTRNKKRVIVHYISRVDGKEKRERIIRKKTQANALRFFVSSEGMTLYFDGKKITSTDYRINPSLRCGLMIENEHSFDYRFFNVFQLAPYKIYDESRFTDNGIKLTHSGIQQGWVQDYSYTLDTGMAQRSRYAERFELRSNTITDYSNDRVEKSFNYQLQTNLRKIHIEFDILIPEDFTIDETLDCLMQIHDRVDDASLEGRSPYFSIRLQNNHFMLTSMSIEKYAKTGFKVDKIIPIEECELGKWTHFSIYIKEGYLPEHHPVTRIEMDGQLVYESIDPNCNNNPRGGYIRYGIYKADWLKGRGDTSIQDKVIYFDNFIVKM